MDAIINSDHSDRYKFKLFRILYGVVQVLGILIIGCMFLWCFRYLHGFAGADNPKVLFNWHPLFMTFGMIVLNGNSILVYRGLRNLRKQQLKTFHATLFMVMFTCITIALYAVFQSHNLGNPPVPNLYSLHSWIGLIAVIIICCQWLAGFTAFLYPTLKTSYKERYMPIHIYVGLLSFGLSVVSALLGITEKIMFSLKDEYAQLPSEGILANLIGIMIILFACILIYIVTNHSYKRTPLPEDAILLTGNEE